MNTLSQAGEFLGTLVITYPMAAIAVFGALVVLMFGSAVIKLARTK